MYTSPSNTARNQSNYSALVVTAGVRSGLCPLKALRRTAFSRAHFNTSTPTFVTTAWNIAKRSSVVVEGTGPTYFCSLPTGRDLFCLVLPTKIIPLTSWVSLSPSLPDTLAIVCWSVVTLKRHLCLIVRYTSSRICCRIAFSKAIYPSDVRLKDSGFWSTTMFWRITSRTLKLKLCWSPHSRISWGLHRTHEPSLVKNLFFFQGWHPVFLYTIINVEIFPSTQLYILTPDILLCYSAIQYTKFIWV
jgi:hypothetical protein